jgi:hypothetical protein
MVSRGLHCILQREEEIHMCYEAEPLPFKPDRLEGLSGRVRLRQPLHADVQRESATVAVPNITIAELRSEMVRDTDITFVDVCLAEDLARRSNMLPGACFLAPEAIDETANALPRDEAIVVYCLYGFQVSGEATVELRRGGMQARACARGIAASGTPWQARRGRLPNPNPMEGRHDEMDHARAAEDRPYCLPLADPALHRSRCRVHLCADRTSVHGRQGNRRDTL